MGLYATPPPLAGGTWNCIGPGENYTLLNGTETVATGSASYVITMAYSPTGSNTKVFQLTGCPSNTIVNIQASNTDVDADYVTVGTLTGSGLYTDIGSSLFYRAEIGTFENGDKPVVTINRG